jgi:ubiquinone/menaquinone biosynthesis C-methylase UbiE
MESDNITTQYNFIGDVYVNGQDSFFSSKATWGREKIKEFIGDLNCGIIIDAGCGHGVDTQNFLDLGAGKVFAFDPSETMLSIAKERVSSDKVIFSIGDYRMIPVEDNSSDVLVGRFSLHYVPNVDEAYREIYRVLKPGGKMIFLLPHPFDDFSRKVKNSNEQEIISVSLYNEAVTVRYPSHTFSDYFSDYFLGHFILSGFAESTPDEMGKKDFPTAFIFSATKK